MVRRRFTVGDIAEILEQWQTGRIISSVSISLGICRPTERKYFYAAEARTYHQDKPIPPQGWKLFLREVVPDLLPINSLRGVQEAFSLSG